MKKTSNTRKIKYSARTLSQPHACIATTLPVGGTGAPSPQPRPGTSDFYLFAPLKKHQGARRRFNTDTEVQQGRNDGVSGTRRRFLLCRLRRLGVPLGWTKCLGKFAGHKLTYSFRQKLTHFLVNPNRSSLFFLIIWTNVYSG